MKSTLLLLTLCGIVLSGCSTTRTSVSSERTVPATDENIDKTKTYDGKAMNTTEEPRVLIAPDEILKPRQ